MAGRLPKRGTDAHIVREGYHRQQRGDRYLDQCPFSQGQCRGKNQGWNQIGDRHFDGGKLIRTTTTTTTHTYFSKWQIRAIARGLIKISDRAIAIGNDKRELSKKSHHYSQAAAILKQIQWRNKNIALYPLLSPAIRNCPKTSEIAGNHRELSPVVGKLMGLLGVG